MERETNVSYVCVFFTCEAVSFLYARRQPTHPLSMLIHPIIYSEIKACGHKTTTTEIPNTWYKLIHGNAVKGVYI